MQGRARFKHQPGKRQIDVDRIDYRILLRVYKVFGNHYKNHWRQLLIAYCGLLLTVAFALLTPWPLKLIMDYVILKNPLPPQAALVTHWFGSDPATLLAVLALAFIGVNVADSFVSYFHKVGMMMVSAKMIREIRERIFAHMQRLSVSFHESFRSGDLVYRMISDLRELPTILLGVPQNIVYRLVTIGSHVGLMWAINWRLALTAFSVIPIMYYYNRRFGTKVRKATKKKRNTESNIASMITESVTAMALVHAYGREDSQQARFAAENRQSLESTLTATRLSKVFSRVTDTLVAIGTCLVVYYGGNLALSGVITPGTLVLFVAYLKKLYSPLDKFASMLLDLARSQVAAERILELIDSDMVMEDAPNAVPAPAFAGRIEFRRVNFAYKKNIDVLKQVSFAIAPGETVALVGHSGAGKSTLVSLLLRFYDPQQGQVLIDGVDIREFTLKSLRGQLTVLMQEAKLFNKTVRQNIAFGKIDATDEEVVIAAKLAQAHEFIEQMPQGYDTMILQGGENLSGGQKQRLNIARAIIRNTPIVIFDEPATALDAKTEAKMHAALDELTAGKTTLIIAHKFSTIARANKILVLEEGRLAGFGTHEQLIKICAPYRELYELQFGRARELAPATVGDEGKQDKPAALEEVEFAPETFREF